VDRFVRLKVLSHIVGKWRRAKRLERGGDVDQALDDALEATFPASDPPAIPWTRIGDPYHPG
jgi:hypothetical protein